MPKGVDTAARQDVLTADRYLHYAGESNVWFLAGGQWRRYVTNDPSVKALIQEAFACPGDFKVSVWCKGTTVKHVQLLSGK